MSVLQPLAVTFAFALSVALLVVLGVWLAQFVVARGSGVFWTALTLAPAVLSFSMVIALLSPGLLGSGCHCCAHGSHHPHLCWMHPTFAEPFVLPALALLGGWLLLRGPAMFAALWSIVRSSRLVRRLGATPVAEIDGIRVHLVDCGEPTAFTAGMIWPRIVIDRSLWEALDTRSLRAVVHHEQAHLLRRDGLTQTALRLVAACFSARLMAGAVVRWTLASEQECDRHAAARIGSAVDVAAALIAVEKLRVERVWDVRADLAPAIASTDLDRRVRALLGAQRRDASVASDLIAVAIVAAGILFLAAFWPGDAIHHAAETLLGYALPH